MLQDLDELVLQCRDERARAYIREAVSCYRGGAYRAAIVSTWVAVAYDVIDKIRELALTGDNQAGQLQDEFEKIRAAGNLPQALAFEKKLLDVARDTFELISHVEYVDLARIRDDRNRCAHPSMTADGDVFSPPGELARLHIRIAVEHLLKHEPAQGKAALERVLSMVASRYFPEELSGALAVLTKSPLQKARESLIRNFVITLLKRLLAPADTNYQAMRQQVAALLAVAQFYPDKVEKIYAADMPRLFDGLDRVPELLRVLELADRGLPIWDVLHTGQQTILKNFVENLPGDEIDSIDLLLKLEPVKAEAARRLKRLTLAEVQRILTFAPHPLLRQQLISCFARVGSIKEANQWGQELEHYHDDFTRDEIARILSSAAQNENIREGSRLPALVSKLRKSKVMKPEEFDSLIESNGLQEHIHTLEL